MLLLAKCIKSGHEKYNSIVTKVLDDGKGHTFKKEFNLNIVKNSEYAGCTINDFEVLELPNAKCIDIEHQDIFENDLNFIKNAKGKIIGYEKIPLKVKALPVKLNNINQIDVTKTDFTHEEQGIIFQTMIKFLQKQAL